MALQPRRTAAAAAAAGAAAGGGRGPSRHRRLDAGPQEGLPGRRRPERVPLVPRDADDAPPQAREVASLHERRPQRHRLGRRRGGRAAAAGAGGGGAALGAGEVGGAVGLYGDAQRGYRYVDRVAFVYLGGCLLGEGQEVDGAWKGVVAVANLCARVCTTDLAQPRHHPTSNPTPPAPQTPHPQSPLPSLVPAVASPTPRNPPPPPVVESSRTCIRRIPVSALAMPRW
jgi:hypothetical protein